MDYLDPHKQFRHQVTLLSGYVFISIAILFAAYLLVNLAYGYGLGKNGTVIQNGLLYVSSQPHPADIYLNGQIDKSKTNARIILPANIYQLKLQRSGYRTWQRTIEVDGGSVEHFDYPLLFPTNLVTTKLGSYTSAPGLTTESPDRRWLVVEQPGSMTDFALYDLKTPTKAPTTISLPGDLLSKATSSQSWQFVDWADDNQHFLLEHLYDGKTEYILVDRANPDQSLNLNQTLKVTPTKLTFNNKKYDQYYSYDTSHNLQTASLKSPTVIPLLSNVLAYATYGSGDVLYVTASDAPTGKVLVKLQSGNQTYILHSLPVGNNYLVDLATYAGTLYVAAGSSSENKVYIYKDPIGQLNNQPTHAVSPAQVLHIDNPTYVSFSTTAQFIMAEGGGQFGVYDILNQQGYNYTSKLPLDAPQTHASWMDGDRLTYVSGGQLEVFDYDDTNQQSLMAASPTYLPAYAPDYSFIYTLAPSTSAPGSEDLTQTSLFTPADQ